MSFESYYHLYSFAADVTNYKKKLEKNCLDNVKRSRKLNLFCFDTSYVFIIMNHKGSTFEMLGTLIFI